MYRKYAPIACTPTNKTIRRTQTAKTRREKQSAAKSKRCNKGFFLHECSMKD